MQNYTPKIHYYVKKGWLNDPNGLVYHNGEYHLFYQHYPNGIQWGPMHWGHAVSRDLIKWEELPIALHANDQWMYFSGSAVVDKHNTSGFFDNNNPGLVAIFTCAKTKQIHGTDIQAQGIAYSQDNGRTWKEYEGNPVIPNLGITDFRDPKVIWLEEFNKWIMVLAEYDHVKFFESENLKEWNLLSDFGKNLKLNHGVWECPDLYRFNEKWILKICVQANSNAGGSGELYYSGVFNGKNFIPENTDFKWLDYGKDFYASQSFYNVNNRNILIAWMNNILYQNVIPSNGNRRGFMTVPRELTLNGNELIQLPVRELNNYRSEHKKFINHLIPENLSRKYELFDTAQEINIEIENKLNKDFIITAANELNEEISLKYSADNKKLLFNRNNSGNIEWHDQAKTEQEAHWQIPTGTIEIKIILDMCSAEIFINRGQKVFSNLVFPEKRYNKLIINGIVTVNSIEIYKYK